MSSPPGRAAATGARSSSSEASDPPTPTRKVPVRSAVASPEVATSWNAEELVPGARSPAGSPGFR